MRSMAKLTPRVNQVCQGVSPEHSLVGSPSSAAEADLRREPATAQHGIDHRYERVHFVVPIALVAAKQADAVQKRGGPRRRAHDLARGSLPISDR